MYVLVLYVQNYGIQNYYEPLTDFEHIFKVANLYLLSVSHYICAWPLIW